MLRNLICLYNLKHHSQIKFYFTQCWLLNIYMAHLRHDAPGNIIIRKHASRLLLKTIEMLSFCENLYGTKSKKLVWYISYRYLLCCGFLTFIQQLCRVQEKLKTREACACNALAPGLWMYRSFIECQKLISFVRHECSATILKLWTLFARARANGGA
jgi:hypothetical protein